MYKRDRNNKSAVKLCLVFFLQLSRYNYFQDLNLIGTYLLLQLTKWGRSLLHRLVLHR